VERTEHAIAVGVKLSAVRLDQATESILVASVDRVE
jgi:hypothetical protein